MDHLFHHVTTLAFDGEHTTHRILKFAPTRLAPPKGSSGNNLKGTIPSKPIFNTLKSEENCDPPVPLFSQNEIIL